MLVALPYFMVFILRPDRADAVAGIDRSFCQKMMKWLWLALILEAVSGFLWFWFVTAQMSDQSPWGILDAGNLQTVLGQTQFGQLWLGRAALGIALGVALYFVARGRTLLLPQPSYLNRLFLVLGVLLLIALAWAGHASAGIHHHVLHLVADMLHLLLGAVWPTGLIPLSLFLWHTHRADQKMPPDREIKVLQRFSQISLGAVLVLVVTGAINSWLMLSSWEDLVTTAYGSLLLAKVSIVGTMIGLGAVNRLFLLPRLQAEPSLLRALRRTILAESALALAVLVIVGIMGMTSPPS